MGFPHLIQRTQKQSKTCKEQTQMGCVCGLVEADLEVWTPRGQLLLRVSMFAEGRREVLSPLSPPHDRIRGSLDFSKMASRIAPIPQACLHCGLTILP